MMISEGSCQACGVRLLKNELVYCVHCVRSTTARRESLRTARREGNPAPALIKARRAYNENRSTPEDLGEDEWAEIFWCGQARHNWTHENCKALGAIMWQTLHPKTR